MNSKKFITADTLQSIAPQLAVYDTMTGMVLGLRPCIITLIIVYPAFLLAGILFFRAIVKNSPHKDHNRNKLLTKLRFLLYIVLLPVGAVAAIAILGWLDPLFFLVRKL